MSTENEEWRENSFNEEIQVPAVMVTGLTTERVENVRIVLLTTVKVGIVRIARDLMPTMKEANARSVRKMLLWRPSPTSTIEGGESVSSSLQ